MRNMIKAMIGVFAAVCLLALPQAAHAVGTASGTTITNQATLNFSVGGVGQPAVTSVDPNNGNAPTTNFVVDTAINVNVATTDVAAVTVTTPNSTNNVLTFKVTNLGNKTQDFALTAAPVATGNPGKFANDNFDMAAFSIFVDANGNGTYEPAVDTATFVDELPADQYATVFIVATAPATLTDGYTAAYTLTAQGAQSGAPGALGAIETATNGANGLLGVDVAFADAAGFGAVDGARDGKHTDADDFIVSAPVIAFSKTVAIADPYGGTNAIPGATATYTLTITNNGSASAVLTSIGDQIDANLTLNGVGSWALSSGGGAALVADLNDANADGLGFTAGPPVNLTYTVTTFLTNPNTTVPRAVAGELQAGETLTLTFQATIN